MAKAFVCVRVHSWGRVFRRNDELGYLDTDKIQQNVSFAGGNLKTCRQNCSGFSCPMKIQKMANKREFFPVGRKEALTTKPKCLESKHEMRFLGQYESTEQDAKSPSPRSVMQ